MTAGRLVLVHGFTQTSASWARVRELMPQQRLTTVAVDVPGHGAAGDVRAGLWDAADHVVAAGGVGTYVGYSLGARICLHAALRHPGVVRRLVLVSGTAGIDDAGERASRRSADERLADDIEAGGVAAFLERWLALPLFATLPADHPGRLDRFANTPAGLASSLRLAGTGTQQPLWDRLGELAMPVLCVAGALDPKFVAFAERIHAAVPTSTAVVIADAGHSVHLERPEAFVDVLAGWLADHRDDAAGGSGVGQEPTTRPTAPSAP